MTEAAVSNDEFTAFWNNVLAAKFDRFRNILLGGLSYHSRVPLQNLHLAPGSKVLDVGCGWGDTAIELARMVGPTGSVVGLDCCASFLEQARNDARDAGVEQRPLHRRRRAIVPIRAGVRLLFLPLRNDVLQQPGVRDAQYQERAEARRAGSCSSPGGRSSTTHGQPSPRNSSSIFCPRRATTRRPAVRVHSRWRAPRSSPRNSRPRDSTTSTSKRPRDPVMVGSTVEQAMQFQLALGPAGEIVREAGAEAERRRPEIESALRAELARHLQQWRGHAVGVLDVTARKPLVATPRLL